MCQLRESCSPDRRGVAIDLLFFFWKCLGRVDLFAELLWLLLYLCEKCHTRSGSQKMGIWNLPPAQLWKLVNANLSFNRKTYGVFEIIQSLSGKGFFSSNTISAIRRNWNYPFFFIIKKWEKTIYLIYWKIYRNLFEKINYESKILNLLNSYWCQFSSLYLFLSGVQVHCYFGNVLLEHICLSSPNSENADSCNW